MYTKDAWVWENSTVKTQGLLNGQALDMNEDGKILVSSFVTGIGIWDTRADTVTPFSSSPGFSPNSMNNNGQFIGQIISGGTIPSNAVFWDSTTSTFLNLNPSSTDKTVPIAPEHIIHVLCVFYTHTEQVLTYKKIHG